jgi:hypothetical protein
MVPNPLISTGTETGEGSALADDAYSLLGQRRLNNPADISQETRCTPDHAA